MLLCAQSPPGNASRNTGYPYQKLVLPTPPAVASARYVTLLPSGETSNGCNVGVPFLVRIGSACGTKTSALWFSTGVTISYARPSGSSTAEAVWADTPARKEIHKARVAILATPRADDDLRAVSLPAAVGGGRDHPCTAPAA